MKRIMWNVQHDYTTVGKQKWISGENGEKKIKQLRNSKRNVTIKFIQSFDS